MYHFENIDLYDTAIIRILLASVGLRDGFVEIQ